MNAELSLIKFNFVNFNQVMINSRPFHPTSTIFIKIVSALIASEPDEDKIMSDRVQWIYKNTHEKVKMPLSLIELAVFKNLDRGLNREIEIGNKNFSLIDLYQYLDQVTLELSNIVVAIAKKYSLEIPYIQKLSSTNVDLMS